MWNLKPYSSISETVLHQNLLICLILWMDLLSIYNVIISFISHLENIGSLSNLDLPKFDTFHYTLLVFLNAFIHIITNPKRKLFEYWEAIKFIVIDINFPKF